MESFDPARQQINLAPFKLSGTGSGKYKLGATFVYQKLGRVKNLRDFLSFIYKNERFYPACLYLPDYCGGVNFRLQSDFRILQENFNLIFKLFQQIPN